MNSSLAVALVARRVWRECVERPRRSSARTARSPRPGIRGTACSSPSGGLALDSLLFLSSTTRGCSSEDARARIPRVRARSSRVRTRTTTSPCWRYLGGRGGLADKCDSLLQARAGVSAPTALGPCRAAGPPSCECWLWPQPTAALLSKTWRARLVTLPPEPQASTMDLRRKVWWGDG